ncbi:hypothetical protein JCM5296_005819, partial [Sporobolomyces johnsonii]
MQPDPDFTPPSLASDPVGVWEGAARPESVAGSVRTASSQARREAMERAAEEARQERYAEYLAQEAAYEQQVKDDMDKADAESIARAEGLEAPSGTGDDADVEVLERKLRHAKEEAEALE